MKTFRISRALAVALIGIAMLGSSSIARADIKDYEFRLVDPTVGVGKDKIITVRLVNKTTDKAVPDAVIFATRLDMAKAALGMEGKWQLSLGAKVQGETGTVESKLIVTAQK